MSILWVSMVSFSQLGSRQFFDRNPEAEDLLRLRQQKAEEAARQQAGFHGIFVADLNEF